jgi:NitT/TauT family transport system permease protein
MRQSGRSALFLLILLTAIAGSLLPKAYALDSLQQSKVKPDFATLVIDAFASMYRMFAALGLSFLVALAIGITAAVRPLAAKIIIPIIDILQSIPILGFFPVAITFFIALFNGSPVGIELAAIFLIFSSMVWNMIFSVYESALLIPADLQETSRAFRANPALLLRRLYLPAVTSKLIFNSMMSWSAGWYFLTAAEIISLGSKTYTLQGLGSLLSIAVAGGQYLLAFAALGTLVFVILGIDFIFWRPLESFANRFRYESSSYSQAAASPPFQSHSLRLSLAGRLPSKRALFPLVHLSDFFVRNPRPMMLRQTSLGVIEKVVSFWYRSEQKVFSKIHMGFDVSALRLKRYWRATIAAIIIGVSLFILVEADKISQSIVGLSKMYLSLYADPATAKVVSEIPMGLLLSYLRLTAAYLITLAWTIPVAIKIAKSKNFSRTMSVIQTFAAIPATAFFPFMAVLVTVIPGGLEFPSILLMLTGMQWYMLFNLIGGVRSISGDLEEAAAAFRATKSQYRRRLLFPSIYPSLVTGSITAWGGGWNALIVSEFLVFGNKTYSVLGLGSILDDAAYNLGNTVLILLVVAVMVATIVTVNNLVWRRLYKKVIQKYSMSG